MPDTRGKVLTWQVRIAREEEFQAALDLTPREMGDDQRPAGALVHHANPKWRDQEDVVGRLHTRRTLRQTRANHAGRIQRHIRSGRVPYGIRRQIAERPRSIQIKERVRPVAIDHRQRLVEPQAAWCEHETRRLGRERLHDRREAWIAQDGVVDWPQVVGDNRPVTSVESDDQLADRLPITTGLHDRGAIDDDGRLHERVRMAPDDDVDPGHRARKGDVVAFGDRAVLRLPHAAVAHANDHVRTLGAQTSHHLPGGCDRIGKGEGTRIDRELNGIGAHHAEQTEPDATTLDHHVTADRSGTAECLQAVKCGVSVVEVRVGGQNRRKVAGVVGHSDCTAEGGGPEVEIMIAERRRIVARQGQALQLGAGLLARTSKWRADGGVADIEHEHGSIGFACPPTLGDQCGNALDAANRAVVVERRRRVFRGGADADEIGVNVVRVQDGERCCHRVVRAQVGPAGPLEGLPASELAQSACSARFDR